MESTRSNPLRALHSVVVVHENLSLETFKMKLIGATCIESRKIFTQQEKENNPPPV